MVSRHEQETAPNPPEMISGNFKGKDILSMDQFDTKSLDVLFDVTDEMKIIGKNAKPSKILEGQQAILIFYEASTRTRVSFELAMKQLGGDATVIENPQQFSSAIKGESLKHTIMTHDAYSDLIILRHPVTGSLKEAADAATNVPVINAGDGGQGEHPTQGLLDLYTINQLSGRLDNLTGVIAGDLLMGRTVKSLIRGLALYPGNTLYLLSPEEIKLPRKDFEEFSRRGVNLIEIDKTDDIPPNADFWYWTRVQKERYSEEEYKAVQNRFVVDIKLLDKFSGVNTKLLHPMPITGEIKDEVDKDERAEYLKSQVRNGMYTRMALLGLVLGKIETD